jgi:hypothetical protein
VSKFDKFINSSKAGGAKGERQKAQSAKPLPKREDPERVQALAYVMKETHKLVKAELAGLDGYDYSDLIEELTLGWLKKRGRL